jgi:hypothetical protein
LYIYSDAECTKNILKVRSQTGQTSETDGFKEVLSRKRNSTEEAARTPKKATPSEKSAKAATKNFFAPIRTANMDTDAPATEPSPATKTVMPAKADRSPTIILPSATNLIQLQKELKCVAKQAFEFRNTRNGTRVITKDMADFQTVKLHFESNNLSFYFFPKSENPFKSMIPHLPINTPAEDIAEGLGTLGFEAVSVRQLSTTRRSLEGTRVTIPLFLVTLPRTTKSQELFKLSNLCHVAIKVEAYRSQNPLTQCYNCQKSGKIWANCKQPPC